MNDQATEGSVLGLATPVEGNGVVKQDQAWHSVARCCLAVFKNTYGII